ncbi:MAG: peroxiredoxin [Deltaproteobacteria bacterium]|nr:peroxiredoxin [Deltaproteobacteria bacterium]
MTSTPLIRVGDAAPDFTLRNQHQQDLRLSNFRGQQAVLLCFYPLDWSPVCTTENRCFSNELAQFQACGVQVFGISCDSVWSHQAFATQHGLTHALLADIHRTVCKSYGLYNPDLNTAQRATVLVDKHGKVAWLQVHELGQARDNEALRTAIRTATA